MYAKQPDRIQILLLKTVANVETIKQALHDIVPLANISVSIKVQVDEVACESHTNLTDKYSVTLFIKGIYIELDLSTPESIILSFPQLIIYIITGKNIFTSCLYRLFNTIFRFPIKQLINFI